MLPSYKIIKAFLIPPGIYTSVFIINTIWLTVVYVLVKDKTNATNKILRMFVSIGVVFCFICASLSYAISTNYIAYNLMNSLEYRFTSKRIKPDAIILLGTSYDRATAASRLYRENKVDVISSGHEGGAEYMAGVMIKNNVHPDHIILESKSTNTKDHVKYILPIAKEKGYKSVYLVTSAYHMPRSMMNFQKVFANNGIEVVPYPCDYYTQKKYHANNYELVPNIRDFQISTIAWNEYLGMLELWLF